MTIRSRVFTLTDDRMIAKTEAAGGRVGGQRPGRGVVLPPPAREALPIDDGGGGGNRAL